MELGAGGGTLAVHLKQFFRLTLTDVYPAMLGVSRAVNPHCDISRVTCGLPGWAGSSRLFWCLSASGKVGETNLSSASREASGGGWLAERQQG